jgi:hypothetical protein
VQRFVFVFGADGLRKLLEVRRFWKGYRQRACSLSEPLCRSRHIASPPPPTLKRCRLGQITHLFCGHWDMNASGCVISWQQGGTFESRSLLPAVTVTFSWRHGTAWSAPYADTSAPLLPLWSKHTFQRCAQPHLMLSRPQLALLVGSSGQGRRTTL